MSGAVTDDILALLALAAEHDGAALECRRAAGRVLAEMRHEADSDTFRRLLDGIGIDTRTARLLLDMASAGREVPSENDP